MMSYQSDQNSYFREINKFISRKYRVVTLISKGGTSEIYKAVDSSKNSIVAIKILPSHYSASDEKGGKNSIGKTLDISYRIIEKSAEFMAQEADFLKSCHHPNIIRLHDYNLEAQRPYIVLDYLGNVTLEKEIVNSKKRISIKKILAILTHLCAALGYVHRKGFVYCDIKPSNIMSRGQKYSLIDFGLVRPIGMSISGGTIGYMAPEVLQSDGHQVKANPTLDVYSLGILLYELLTGFHPLASQKIYGTENSYHFDHQSITDKSATPSPASDLNPLSPKALDEILFRCIIKNPKDRYQNTDSLLKDFEKEASKLI